MSALDIGIDLQTSEYHRESGTHHASYDQHAITASEAVVAVLAAVTDTDPTDTPPLYSAIDPDALDALVSVPSKAAGAVDVAFTVGDSTVHASNDGSVTVSTGEPESRDAPSGEDALE